ncbi:chaperone modulator CbpM [Agarivorans sp. MS3-6]|uniref:chaperone modulator CbpM n=1 Tax=Agarivorans sp. TSD2052 TaxID=2937286 RepID=UPI002010A87D|nr:chaperone modulator CbpM [Agarivorans sp. TSD2052]UPW17007.1 chaperone modulator CbpM [Agarivorans sp. TSD2052]
MSNTLLHISFRELCQVDGLESDQVIKLVEYGIVQPIQGNTLDAWVFDANSVHWIKKAVRIYHDLEVDWVAVALAVNLMKENEALAKQNLSYQRQLARLIKP